MLLASNAIMDELREAFCSMIPIGAHLSLTFSAPTQLRQSSTLTPSANIGFAGNGAVFQDSV